jgi:putative CocE/NonD family hydrolase
MTNTRASVRDGLRDDKTDKLFSDMLLDADQAVPTRDGERLVTDIYRPAHGGIAIDGRFPVILERTPYGKDRVSRGEIDSGATVPMERADVARYFVERGYIVVYQDCRGRGGSSGEFIKYLSEGQDGVDTINWLRRQPWCNGRIGMMGLSYSAHTQVAAACLAPEGLDALVVDCGGFSSGYHWGMRQGGALELRQATWAFVHAKASPLAKADPTIRAALEAEDIGAWFKALPWKPGHSPLRWVPEYEDYLFEQWRNGSFSSYWKKPGIYARGSYPVLAQVPQVHLTGWYDTYIATAIENFVGVTTNGCTSAMLIVGPWTHGDRALSFAGDVDFGAHAPLDGNLSLHWREFRRRWFDLHLRDETSSVVGSQRPVKIFVMGGGSGAKTDEGRMDHGGFWIEETSWSLEGSEAKNFYFTPNGGLSLELDETREATLSFRFDPANPVPTIGGSFSSGAPLFHAGAYDQREADRFFGSSRPGMPLSARGDVLVFQTEPLSEDIVVVGHVNVELWISSDSVDTDFTAKLIDEYPPSADWPRGFSMNLTDGIRRCRYRDGWEEPQMMEPGEIYRVTIELPPTANVFKAGHRIRVDVSSSNFPKFDVNPNSGERESEANLKRVATNTIHIAPTRASRMILNVVDRPLQMLST